MRLLSVPCSLLGFLFRVGFLGVLRFRDVPKGFKHHGTERTQYQAELSISRLSKNRNMFTQTRLALGGANTRNGFLILK